MASEIPVVRHFTASQEVTVEPRCRADPVPVKVLPELAFDMSEGQPLAPCPGKTSSPVNIMPELVFDIGSAEPEPA